MSKLRAFWENYKVLIVMGSGLGFVHWGWYNIKSSPLLRPQHQDLVPEPGIVSYVAPGAPPTPALPPLPEPKRKRKEEKTKE